MKSNFTLKSLFLGIALSVFGLADSHAQIGIGNTSPQGALDITSVNDGLLIPRVALALTTTATVTTPTTSEMVYNTATAGDVTPGFYYWDGIKWVRIVTGAVSNDWTNTGNTGTTAGTNFIGTTDAIDFVTKTNNTEKTRVTSAGNVGIGVATPQGALDITSTNNGLLIPRVALALTTIATVTTPTTSEMVYNTATAGDVTPGFYYWDGAKWVRIVTGAVSNDWTNTGNTGTTAGTNFIGTTDAIDFVTKTNNTEKTRVTSAGNVGIGTAAPAAKLDVAAAVTTVNSVVNATGSINDFLQYNIQNTSTGIQAQSGYSATADNGSATTGFAWLGINNSAFNFPTAYNIGVANDVSYVGSGQDMYIANANNTKSIIFSTGKTATPFFDERMRILNNGNVGIGAAAPANKLEITQGTAGNSGLRFTNLTSASVLSTNASGDIIAAITNAANGTFWGLTGNSGTTAATNFVGTTDAVDFVTRTNSLERMRVLSGGRISVNNATPATGDLFSATTNSTNFFAISGYNNQPTGEAIYGINTDITNAFPAIQGATNSPTNAGVYGNSTAIPTAGSPTPSGLIGGYNGSTSSGIRIGVNGISGSVAAVTSGNQLIGVQGSYTGSGTFHGIGVYGIGLGGAIIAGAVDAGVVGWRANNQNYSGYFNGNHVIANGTKSASVGTSKGNQLLYVTETPGVWFEDIGRGKLVNGTVKITLDPIFLETVFIDSNHPISVFLQEEGESNGLYVTVEKDGFTVKEKKGGTSNISFSYRIMAKRLHFQDHRFGNDPLWGSGDTRKYNRYAKPPPIDFNENSKFQEDQNKNTKPDLYPEGFTTYEMIQKVSKSKIK
jgi:hypothetical protein